MSTTYISIPDPTATTTAGTNCAGIGLSGSYHCAASSTYRLTNGTGWIPVNLASLPAGSPIGSLPVDPINTTSSGEYYEYATNGTSYEISASPESSKYKAQSSSFYGGSSLSLITPPVTQNIWVADTNGSPNNNRVEEFSSTGVYESQFGSSGTGNGQFFLPDAIAIDSSGNIWVADAPGCRVEEFSSSGVYESKFGSFGSTNGKFNVPNGIAVDASGNVWVTDSGNNRVQEFSSSSVYESQFGSAGSSTGQFGSPAGIAIDSSGNLWVVDSNNNRVQEFSSAGVYKAQFGSSGSGNGQFSNPYDIAIDSSGNIWVGDYGNSRVEEFSSSGVYESQFGSTGSGNGQFTGPYGIAIH